MNFKQEAVRLKLDQLFGQGHFSICDIDQIARAIGTNPKSHPHYNDLQLLHCVDYSKMNPEMIEELKFKCMEVLTSKVDTDLMTKAIFAVRNGEVKDLPNIEDSDTLRLIK